MQLSLIETNSPDGRPVDVEFRHEDPELPAYTEADNQPLVATLPLDLLSEQAKSQARAHLNLSSGELQLIHEGQTHLVGESRTADEIRLTLYTKLVKNWQESADELPPSALSLIEHFQTEIERLSNQAPQEQAPGQSEPPIEQI